MLAEAPVGARLDDRPGRRRLDRRPRRTADVDPVMMLSRPIPRGTAHPVPRLDRSADRPPQRERVNDLARAADRVRQLAQPRPFLGDAGREEVQLFPGRRLDAGSRADGLGSGTAGPRARLGTERVPHLGVQRPPGRDLAADRGDPRVKRVDERALFVHAPAKRRHLVPLTQTEHVPAREAGGGQHSERPERPVDDPARQADA